ncbi:MAG: hypothetical protein EOP13_32120 [Pseudomonas sp.]|nr:MAG: hypothetical protein EOP13_32120 [Pseudomonas sp.]
MKALLIFVHKKPKHCRTRLGCRLNAGLAQWAEPQGCGESAVRTWMSVRRGPTERDRSEGTPTQEGPNQEQAPLVTWGALPSNSPKAKQSAPRQTLLIFYNAPAPLTYSINLITAGAFSWRRWISDNDELG